MNEQIDIAALRALEQAATRGPWTDSEDHCVGIFREDGIHVMDICECENLMTQNADANAAFIAASRTAIPALLDAYEASLAENARLRAELDAAKEKYAALESDALSMNWRDCDTCIHSNDAPDESDSICLTPGCNSCNWQWRGADAKTKEDA